MDFPVPLSPIVIHFLSTFWKNLFALSGTKLAMSSAYHPQIDGETEVVNRGLEQYLDAFVQDNPYTWITLLSWAEFHYNTNYHSSLKMSPFQALYGRIPPTIPRYTKSSTSVQALDDILAHRDCLLQALMINLLAAENRMACKANEHRRELNFAVGDLVLLRLQPYRQSTVATSRNHKLRRRFYGPFPVLACVGQAAYRLGLPEGSKIHPVFHISVLKPFRGPHLVYTIHYHQFQ